MNRAVSIPPQNAPVTVEAFISSEEAKAAVEQIQHQIGRDGAVTLHSGTLATAARLLGMTSLGDVLIAELGGEDEESRLGMVRDLSADGRRVILLGRQNDVATYRSLIASGARDYLILPLEEGAKISLGLRETVTTNVPAVVHSRRIGVCGVSGGVGASVLAANLAIAYLDCAGKGKLARDSRGRVALIDADLGFGSLAVDFDIESTSGLLEALLAPQRIDQTFLNATMAKPVDGLLLYSSEAREGGRIRALEAGFPALLKQIDAEFPTTVVDLPRRLLVELPELSEGFDELIFVLAPGFNAVRSCSRLLHRINEGKDGSRVSCVLSQTRRDAGLRKSEIETALDRPVDLVLPQCGSDLARASVKGMPLQRMSPRSGYGRALAQLVARLEAQPAQKAVKRGFWNRKKAAGHA